MIWKYGWAQVHNPRTVPTHKCYHRLVRQLRIFLFCSLLRNHKPYPLALTGFEAALRLRRSLLFRKFCRYNARKRNDGEVKKLSGSYVPTPSLLRSKFSSVLPFSTIHSSMETRCRNLSFRTRRGVTRWRIHFPISNSLESSSRLRRLMETLPCLY